jgi:hypothetical protein
MESPEFPTKMSARFPGTPPLPETRHRVPPSESSGTPNVSSASRITVASSESRTPSSVVSPSASAANNSTRLVMLLDPGSVIKPASRPAGGRSIQSLIRRRSFCLN